MTEEEIKEYINRKDELLLKLSDKDKDTLEWILFGYNECARLLDEKEKENQKLKEEKQELVKFLKEEQNRLARECSQIYEDSLGKTRLVNEDIYNEVSKILSKIEKSDK